jgi:O-antigen ligase
MLGLVTSIGARLTRSETVRGALGAAVVTPVLSFCLFGECQSWRNSHALRSILREVGAALSDRGTQWMVFVCTGICFFTLVVLRKRFAGGGRVGTGWNVSLRGELWLVGLLAVAALAYVFDYTQAVKSMQALTLVGGAMIGQGAAVWALNSPKSRVQSLKPAERTFVGVLVVLLLGAAVWQVEAWHFFEYRGQARWSGPWNSPNTFGLLIGVGLVLAVAKLVQSLKSNAYTALLLAAAGMMGFALVKSYSRGAWVGAVVGLGVLVVQGSRLKDGLALAVVMVSLGVLAFWGFRQADRGMVRRAYTVANANDFSWRNRVAAYEGALQMLVAKPCFGFGWNQPERVYDAYYRPAKVDEGMAIQLNDYLTVGTTLGLPALLCFATYVGRCLVRNAGQRESEVQSLVPQVQSPEDGQERTGLPATPTLDFGHWTLDHGAVCRAKAVVLVVGFWFDGGLFKLATGATFWILLELGRGLAPSRPAAVGGGQGVAYFSRF